MDVIKNAGSALAVSASDIGLPAKATFRTEGGPSTRAYDFDDQYRRWLRSEPWMPGAWSSSNVPAFEARKARDAAPTCQAEAEARGLA